MKEYPRKKFYPKRYIYINLGFMIVQIQVCRVNKYLSFNEYIY